MQYLYHPDAGAPHIALDGEAYRYLIKVRRHRTGEQVALRSGLDHQIHYYTIDSIEKRIATLTLHDSEYLEITAHKSLHIGWCIIDPKSIEKSLPALNEIGVERITFIDCARSQKNFRPDFARWEKILLNSSQQCGRSFPMVLERSGNVKEFVAANPEAYLLHFSDNKLDASSPVGTVIIGCEGGFTNDEASLVSSDRIIGFNTPMILRSESAVVAVASHILL